MGERLTEQMKLFCREYIVDHCPVRAMVRAGYSKKNANSNAYKLMRKPQVIEHLAEVAKEASDKNDLTPEKVLKEITRIAFSDVTSFYKYSTAKKKYVLKSLDELTADQKAAISEYKPGEYIKLHSKDSALDKLGKHFKLYTDIDATVNNLFLLPTMRLDGAEVVFKVGKPAPKVITKSG